MGIQSQWLLLYQSNPRHGAQLNLPIFWCCSLGQTLLPLPGPVFHLGNQADTLLPPFFRCCEDHKVFCKLPKSTHYCYYFVGALKASLLMSLKYGEIYTFKAHNSMSFNTRVHNENVTTVKIIHIGNSLAIQWLWLCPLTAETLSSIPNQGTKIQRAWWHGQKKKKR